MNPSRTACLLLGGLACFSAARYKMQRGAEAAAKEKKLKEAEAKKVAEAQADREAKSNDPWDVVHNLNCDMGYAETKPLKGQVALVTGGSQGIGAGIVLELAKAGAHVSYSYSRNRVPADELAVQVRAAGVKALPFQADAGSREDMERMVAVTEQKLGPVTILVTNAVRSVRQTILETKLSDLESTLRVGIVGVFNAMQIVARRMVALNIQGSIIHVSSPHFSGPFKGCIDYNTAKAGAHHLALSAANELAWKKIRVNIIQPGWTVTPGELRYFTKEFMDQQGKEMPLGRMEYPVDCGRVAVFLASPDSAHVAGANIRLDGGQFIEGGPSWIKNYNDEMINKK